MDDKTPFFKGRLVPPKEELTDPAFRLLCHLCDLDYSSQKGTRRGYVFPKDEMLASALGWEETKLKTALRCLEDHKYIRRIRRSAGQGKGIRRLILISHERMAVAHAEARARAQGKDLGPETVGAYAQADAAFEERVRLLKESSRLQGRQSADSSIPGALHDPESVIGGSERSHAIDEPHELQSLYGDGHDVSKFTPEEEERRERRTPESELEELRQIIRSTALPRGIDPQRGLNLRTMARVVLEAHPSFDRAAMRDVADAVVRLYCQSGIRDESGLECALTEAASRAIAASESGILEVGLLIKELPIVPSYSEVDADVCVTVV